MTEATAGTKFRSHRAIAWARRRASWSRGWRIFRKQRSGVVGLLVLAFFVIVALVSPLIWPASDLDVSRATGPLLAPPSWAYPLGTDYLGRSVLTLVCWGARVSLIVGLAATAISMVIGTLVGISSGHYKGIIGAALERLTDWFLVIPFLPLAVVLATILGATLQNVIIVIGITSWPGTARIVRAQTLSVGARPYLERSRALGASDWHQMRRHVLPNVMPLVLANTTLTVAVAILSETTLAFLGLGPADKTSWGSILEDVFNNAGISQGAWWWLLPPGLCVVLVVLAFTLVGRALEVVVDPRMRDR
jgi:peptide/nickel transport system permease protein